MIKIKLKKNNDFIINKMSSFYQSVISIISKPKEKRQDDEIHMILAWFINLFKKKSSLFGDIEPGLNFCAKIMQF